MLLLLIVTLVISIYIYSSYYIHCRIVLATKNAQIVLAVKVLHAVQYQNILCS